MNRSRPKSYPFSISKAAVPEAPLSKAEAKKPRIRYREPAVCTVRLLEDRESVLESRMSVYQLGTVRTLPLK